MSSCLRVISPGLSSLQDSGRKGWAASGVPTSGAFHRDLYQLACSLIDGSSLPAVEILAGRFAVLNESSETTTFTVVGGTDSRVDGVPATGIVLGLAPGQTLEVTAEIGSPGYVVFPSLCISPVLGSVSWDSLSKLGIAPLTAGQGLELLPDKFAERRGRFLSRPFKKSTSSIMELKVTAVPSWQEELAEKIWKVEGVSRSGIRLTNETPLSGGGNSIPSFPVLPGCVQLPPSGQPIILGPDSGVTGGYPVVASVISSDLGSLAELDGKKPVRFVPVSLEEAQEAWFARSRAIASAAVDPSLL